MQLKIILIALIGTVAVAVATPTALGADGPDVTVIGPDLSSPGDIGSDDSGTLRVVENPNGKVSPSGLSHRSNGIAMGHANDRKGPAGAFSVPRVRKKIVYSGRGPRIHN